MQSLSSFNRVFCSADALHAKSNMNTLQNSQMQMRLQRLGQQVFAHAVATGAATVWQSGKDILVFLWALAAAEPTFFVIVGAITLVLLIITLCQIVHSLWKNWKLERSYVVVSHTVGEIASEYGVGECAQAALAMIEYLTKKKQNYVIWKISYPPSPGTIFSLLLEKVNYTNPISWNGTHFGVEYKGRIHCNIHPLGLPKGSWADDCWGMGLKVVRPITLSELKADAGIWEDDLWM